jgi:hypothetical protein
MSQLEPIRIADAELVAAPADALPPAAAGGFRLRRLLFAFSKAGWALRAEMAERAEQGRDVLDGRADLARLKGLTAEPFFQGLDVLEARNERVLEVIAVRAKQGQRNPWRLSPKDRLAKKQPKTIAGQRQAEWLAKLELAGLIKG